MRRQNFKVLGIQLKIVIPSLFQHDEDEDMQNNNSAHWFVQV
jgi:hypothetical protein